eukprot:TRINITY_DN2467_c0_g1_i1.p1 TRINITY_DN2467_c0_g1~~TRINITY_DN2467_c0_g1_i1.p1  ORF type:complete len:505 (+),score=44.46 TRINITY_DN2467_c0_g1_i1:88-1515(+)
MESQKWRCITCGNKLLNWTDIMDTEHLGHQYVSETYKTFNKGLYLNNLAKQFIANIQKIKKKSEEESGKKEKLKERLMLLKQSVIDIIEAKLIAPIMNCYEEYIYDLEKVTKELISKSKEFLEQIEADIKEIYTCIKLDKCSQTLSCFRYNLKQEELKSNLENLFSTSINLDKIINPDNFIQRLMEFQDKYKRENPSLMLKLDAEQYVITAEAGSELNWYDIIAKKLTKVNLKYADSFDHFIPCAKVKNKLYISTGNYGFYEINLLIHPPIFYKKASTLVNKKKHVFVPVNNSFIYSLGGYDGLQITGKCEKYSIAKNKWYKTASLNYPVYMPVAFVMGHSIYCYGGNANNNDILNVFQKLDTLTEEDGWKILHLNFAGNFGEPPKLYFAGAIPTSPETCLIIGGQDAVSKKADCFLIDVNQQRQRIEKMNLKLLGESTIYCQPVFYKGYAWLLEWNNKPIVYDFKRKRFAYYQP